MPKVDFAKGPYTITSTGTVGQSTSGFWDVNDKGSDNGATACTEKSEEDKPSDIPYEEYIKVVYENELLKQIIIELNKQLYKEKIKK